MSIQTLNNLAILIKRERSALLSRWREQVRLLPSAKHLDTPTLNDHIPALLDELADAFQSASVQTIQEALLEGTPPVHGLQRHQDGFDIVEVVAEYNILRGCIHDLAETNNISLSGKPFHIMNRVFDEAISFAVQTFATGQALEVQRRRDEYLAFVTHDLRTPLNAIFLAVRVLESSISKPDESANNTRLINTLRRNVQRLKELIENVLKESAHIGTETSINLVRREFDLWPIIESLIYDLHPLAEASSTKLVNSVPENIVIFADAGLLKRVIQNLIANAIKYTPHGKVDIGAGEIDAEGTIECWVSDNGAGIPEDRLELVFDKLETDPENEGGTGLGLAIVKMYVEAHDGTVTVESKEGIGSTFRFTLPGRRAVSRCAGSKSDIGGSIS